MKNYMKLENYNKAMCKSCIFRTDGNRCEITIERMNEIKDYLAKGEKSHICHTTEKTCYGALTFQSQIFYRLGIINEPTPRCLIETANKYLKN